MHIYAFDLNCINLQKVNNFWSLIVKRKHFFLLKVSFQTSYIPLKNPTKTIFFLTEIHLNLLKSMVFTLAIILIVLMMNERYVYVLNIYKKLHTMRH